VTWYKGARDIAHGGKYHISHDGDTYMLTVYDIYGEDADEYVCRAVNKAGAKSTRAELVIMSPPKLHVPPRFRDTAYFDKGENVIIKIPFTGVPRPKISWLKEGEKIETGAHFNVEVKERHAVLTIRDASRIDNGPYSIVAENELGMDNAIIKIQISGEWGSSLVLGLHLNICAHANHFFFQTDPSHHDSQQWTISEQIHWLYLGSLHSTVWKMSELFRM
jgi:hypothetical protein